MSWYPDGDGDLAGDDSLAVVACEAPEAAWVLIGGDCDDADALNTPGASEACDGQDNDCDGSIDEGVPWGTASCPSTSCAELLSVAPTTPTATYYLHSNAGPIVVDCDMDTAGGGWTHLDSDALSNSGWLETSGGPGPHLAEWRGLALRLEPYGSWDASTNACTTGYVRASINLPFTFTEWVGSWSATPDAPGLPDDDHQALWGDTAAGQADCPGRVSFGTDSTTSKPGGEWGPGFGTRGWSWSTEALPTTSEIRWEYADDGSYNSEIETVDITNIDIWVR